MQRIIYLSWPATEMTGGIKMIFRHVEALREAGFTALVATADGQPPAWFESSAPTMNLAGIRPETDVLVFPENNNALLEQFSSLNVPKVVFCQSQYMIFGGLGKRSNYADFGVKDILCPSQNTAHFCRRRFHDSRIFVIPNYVDPTIFRVRREKKLQIAYMPAKRPLEVSVVFDLFRAENPQWSGIPWIGIQNKPEQEVARILGESALCLSLCRLESFSLALLEALACGCITAGFTGIGSREIACRSNGFWAEEDDCLDCVDKLTDAVGLVHEGGNRLWAMYDAAVRTTEQFSRERFVRALTQSWITLGVTPGETI